MPNMEQETQIETKPQEVTRDNNGRWITPPPSPAPISHANARLYAKKRWDKSRAAAAAAVIEEGRKINAGISSMPGVWGLVNAHLFNTIIKSDKPRPQAVELLGKNIGAIASEADHELQEGESGLESDLRGLVRLLSGALKNNLHDTIDGELKE